MSENIKDLELATERWDGRLDRGFSDPPVMEIV